MLLNRGLFSAGKLVGKRIWILIAIDRMNERLTSSKESFVNAMSSHIVLST